MEYIWFGRLILKSLFFRDWVHDLRPTFHFYYSAEIPTWTLWKKQLWNLLKLLNFFYVNEHTFLWVAVRHIDICISVVQVDGCSHETYISFVIKNHFVSRKVELRMAFPYEEKGEGVSNAGIISSSKWPLHFQLICKTFSIQSHGKMLIF